MFCDIWVRPGHTNLITGFGGVQISVGWSAGWSAGWLIDEDRVNVESVHRATLLTHPFGCHIEVTCSYTAIP